MPDFTLVPDHDLLTETWSPVTMADCSFARIVLYADMFGCITTVWPKDRIDGSEEPIATVHKSLSLVITQRFDSVRYLGSYWGSDHGHYRAFSNTYDKLDPANYRADRGQFFRDCRAQFGKCTGRTPDGNGWIFGRTDRSYDRVYIETIVRVIGTGHQEWNQRDERTPSA